MGIEGLPIFLQVAESFTGLISHAGTLAKTILVILLVLSVVSWTIMFEKFRFFRRSAEQSKRFLASFAGGGSLAELAARSGDMAECAEASLLAAVHEGMERGELRKGAFLERFLESKVIGIVTEWESYLIFLSTTATISPFLGLLGTVWGIMSSFLSMGVRGSANLYVVGPGIAEALITTIFGLGAAIPAVIGYNYILRVIRRREDQLVEFGTRLRSRLIENEPGDTKNPDVAGGDLLSKTL